MADLWCRVTDCCQSGINYIKELRIAEVRQTLDLVGIYHSQVALAVVLFIMLVFTRFTAVLLVASLIAYIIFYMVSPAPEMHVVRSIIYLIQRLHKHSSIRYFRMQRVMIMAIFTAILLIAPLIPASIALITTLVVEEVLSVALTPISNTTPPRAAEVIRTMSTPTLLRHAPMLAHQPYSRPSETTITKEVQYKVRIIIIIYYYYYIYIYYIHTYLYHDCKPEKILHSKQKWFSSSFSGSIIAHELEFIIIQSVCSRFAIGAYRSCRWIISFVLLNR